MNKCIYLILAVILFGMASCEKAELKKPTDIELSFDFKKNFNSNIKIKVISGQINLIEFGMTGTRVEGDDIQFSEKIENLLIPLNGEINTDLVYQIPQGVYDYMQINVSLIANGDEPSIVLNGTFKESNAVTKNVQFVHNFTESFEIIGESSNQGDIVLTKSKTEQIDIIFDAIYWFETLTSDQLTNAEVVTIDGQETITLSEFNNTELYEIVLARMNNTHRAIFN